MRVSMIVPKGNKPRHKTYVVLRSNRPVVVLVEEGELLQDILAHTGDLAEEEEREDASADTESAGNLAAVQPQPLASHIVSQGRTSPGLKVLSREIETEGTH